MHRHERTSWQRTHEDLRSGNASGEDVTACLQEWDRWMREHRAWLDDVAVWDRQLRRLLVLIHELDKALPYERRRLVEHHDAIQSHQRVLQSHQGILNGHQGQMTGQPDALLSEMHGRQRHQHARVRDAHLALQRRHGQAMQQVDELIDQFHHKGR